MSVAWHIARRHCAFILSLALLIGLLLWPAQNFLFAQTASRLTFTDVTEAARLSFKHEASPTSQKYLIETMGAGVAVLDYNRDGWLDLFFVNGARLDDPMPASKEPDKTDKKFWNRLYKNNGDGTFSDVIEKAGLAGKGYGMGVAAGDFDNDGFADLFVTNYGRSALYRNNGDGTFADVTAKAKTSADGWAVSAGWVDYDNDGWLDLFVCRYMHWDFANNPYCGEQPPGARAYCHPRYFKGVSDILYRNNGDGTFTDVSQPSGIAAATADGKALGVAFADFDNDGWSDIIVANDSIRQTLLHNKRNGTFADVALLAGVGFDDNGKAFAGMGVEFVDYDNDGWSDVFITNLSNETYALYRNAGDETFNYVTNSSGIGEATMLYSGWGTKFFDYDHDGWKDLFITQGHVLDTIQLTSPHLRWQQSPLLLRNVGKKFVNVSATLGQVFKTAYAGRGMATGDLDNDGDLDVIVSNNNQRAYLLRNDGANAAGNWLIVNPVGTRSNRQGIGAKLKLVTASGQMQSATVTTAGSYASSSDHRAHFGLAQEKVVKLLEIKWPSGAVQRLENITVNQTLNVKEPEVARATGREK